MKWSAKEILSKRDRYFLAKAVELARKSDCLQRHGCVAVHNGKIVATGWNRYLNDINNLTDETARTYGSRHAEAHVLKKLVHPKNTVIYIARISRGGNVSYSAPCSMCRDLLISSGIRKIVHT